MEIAGQQIANLLTMWSVYTLAAIGLSLVFSVMRVINFAHAQFYMMGGFVAWFAVARLGLSYFLGLALAAIAAALLGYVVERWLIRPVGDDQLRAMTSTLGLLLAMGGVASLAFGPQSRNLASPVPENIHVLQTDVPAHKVLIAVAAAVALLALFAFLKWTWRGRALSAVAQDADGAQLQGIGLGATRSMGFMIGTGLAGLAGALILPISAVDPTTGDAVLLKMFVILVLGGLGSLGGAVFGALVLALIETVGISAFGQYSILSAYVLVAVILLIKPAGIFGRAAA